MTRTRYEQRAMTRGSNDTRNMLTACTNTTATHAVLADIQSVQAPALALSLQWTTRLSSCIQLIINGKPYGIYATYKQPVCPDPVWKPVIHRTRGRARARAASLRRSRAVDAVFLRLSDLPKPSFLTFDFWLYTELPCTLQDLVFRHYTELPCTFSKRWYEELCLHALVVWCHGRAESHMYVLPETSYKQALQVLDKSAVPAGWLH